jgi:hypothetical protein
VYFEHLQTDVYRPRAFEQARGTVVRELRSASTFSRRVSQLQSGGFRLLDPAIRTAPVVFGSDFERTTAPTRSSHEVDGTPKAGDIDDVVTRLLDAFLGGDAVPRAALLEGYVHELVQTQREQFGSDDGFEVPDARLLEQYVQFRALEAIGAVTAGTDGGREAANSTWLTTPRDESSSADGSPTSDESSTTTAATRPSTGDTPVTQTESATETDGAHDDRDALLASFLADHAVLDDSDPHRATFLLGGLVGRISALQRRNDISSTLTRRYPIDYLTKQSIKEVTKAVLDANETYIQSMDGLSGAYNRRYVEPLPDLMLAEDPSDWSVTQNELQWVYALGIAYGTNDISESEDDDGNTTDDESDSAAADGGETTASATADSDTGQP